MQNPASYAAASWRRLAAEALNIYTTMALFSFQKSLQNFSDYLLHQIFRRMHEVLNIDENKN